MCLWLELYILLNRLYHMSNGILLNFKPVLIKIYNKTAVCSKIIISFYKDTISINIYICDIAFF